MSDAATESFPRAPAGLRIRSFETPVPRANAPIGFGGALRGTSGIFSTSATAGRLA
jgi:hypothetical protein